MAQNITLMGASYTAVPAVVLPKTGGGSARFDDTSDADAIAADIAQGKTAYVDGAKVVGTASGGGVLTVTLTLTNGEWTPDKTFAQIQSAYAQGLTVEVVAQNSTSGEPCQTACGYNSDYAQFQYWVSWFDYDDTGHQFVDFYIYSSSELVLDDRQEYGTPTTLVQKTITANGTYNPILTDHADGYSLVTVNVPSSGSSGWTKIAETTYQVSTTSTTAATVATFATGHNELWTSTKWIYVRIRDTAGKRSGYFYGSDQYMYVANTSNTSASTAMRICMKVSTSGTLSITATSGSSGYGVWADTLYSDGRVRIRSRYHSFNSLTVDGTFKVEVYLLDSAGGEPIFP